MGWVPLSFEITKGEGKKTLAMKNGQALGLSYFRAAEGQSLPNQVGTPFLGLRKCVLQLLRVSPSLPSGATTSPRMSGVRTTFRRIRLLP